MGADFALFPAYVEMRPVTQIQESTVRGWMHTPQNQHCGVVALTHGAGSNCGAPLLIAVAHALVEAGLAVLRYDLPFRHSRPSGPPVGGKKGQALDREGIRAVAAYLREVMPSSPIYLAGHSYGGRQSTMAASEDPKLADGLLLLSYPLHPPGQPEKLRTEHFPAVKVPALFAHGTKDKFGSAVEMQDAIRRIPARTELLIVDRAGHGLAASAAASIVESFVKFFTIDSRRGRS